MTGRIRIDIEFRADLIVEDRVIVEIRPVEALARFTKSNLSPIGDHQRGVHYGWHFPYRQWIGRRLSRKVARTPRTRVKLRFR
jgi:hypothetical protein